MCFRFSDILVNLSSGLNFANVNSRDASCGSNFVDRKFCNISHSQCFKENLKSAKSGKLNPREN